MWTVTQRSVENHITGEVSWGCAGTVTSTALQKQTQDSYMPGGSRSRVCGSFPALRSAHPWVTWSITAGPWAGCRGRGTVESSSPGGGTNVAALQQLSFTGMALWIWGWCFLTSQHLSVCEIFTVGKACDMEWGQSSSSEPCLGPLEVTLTTSCSSLQEESPPWDLSLPLTISTAWGAASSHISQLREMRNQSARGSFRDKNSYLAYTLCYI